MKLKTAENNTSFWLRYIPAAAICFVFAFLLICSPDTAKNGIADGIDLCLKILIPSLFPFLFLSSFTVSSQLHLSIGRLLRKPVRFLFRQPESAASIIIMSMIGGLPVGAKMTALVYSKNQLTQSQAQRLMLYCVNSGPAFVISAVGGSMLGSYKAGVIIYVSLCTASLIVGILTRFLPDSDSQPTLCAQMPEAPPKLFVALTQAAESSSTAMMSICVWVMLFSCAISLFEANIKSEGALIISASVLEITKACRLCAGKLSIPLIAGIIGWAGISAHCQILSSCIKAHIKISVFMCSRVINGALAALICDRLLTLFPIETAAMMTPSGITASPFRVSLPISIGLMMMCAALLINQPQTN